MKKILVLISIIIMILIYKNELNKFTIPSNSIRIRIIANSNKIEDQLLKLKVKENVQKKLFKKLNKATNIEQARSIINDSIDEINNEVSNLTNQYSIKYGYNYFPEKNFYGVKYEDGNYESLVINLGEGKGNNWWCVLFPPLCLLDVEREKNDNVQYKSKVLEILKAYK